MNKRELGIFAGLAVVFLLAYFLNFTDPKIKDAIMEAFYMLQWYARYHTLACVVPAMFIAGAIATFFSKEAVLRHLGPKANRVEAYGVASVSGTVLAVCSCSVLPMFAGIYRVGQAGPRLGIPLLGSGDQRDGDLPDGPRAGLRLGHRPADRFGRVRRGHRLDHGGHLPQGRGETDGGRNATARSAAGQTLAVADRPLLRGDDCLPGLQRLGQSEPDDHRQDGWHADAGGRDVGNHARCSGYGSRSRWGLKKGEKVTISKAEIDRTERSAPANYQWAVWVYEHRWYFAGACFLATLAMVGAWFDREELSDWMGQTWDFAKSIVPLLFGGVLVTGFVGALIPEEAVAKWVGGDSFQANMVASVIGAMWYFATLTEIPILETLLGLGMGRGPALALLLAGPALSLPSIAVIYSVVGFKKTAVFTGLVIVMSAVVGMIFGWFFV